MERDKARYFEHAKIIAQQCADHYEEPVYVIELHGIPQAVLKTVLTSEDEILYTAQPSVHWQLTPNDGAIYNPYEIRITHIRKTLDDDGEEIEVEDTTARWSIEYARSVQEFLNKVLGSEENQ
ncbi:MAG: hypothetical protein AUG51_12995 [Acidobacteria bacterium 13_1_20CM_3_53_8]|nr:MAG: hypothetical protein AUG51_12995 [Acidobacteria bacterium 13_1_20CM_3_53_8]